MRNAGGGRRTGLRRGGLFHVSNRHRRRSFGFLGLDLPRCILLLAAALCIIGGAINVHSMNAHHDAHVKTSTSPSSAHVHGTDGFGASKSSSASASSLKTKTKKTVDDENEDIDDMDDNPSTLFLNFTQSPSASFLSPLKVSRKAVKSTIVDFIAFRGRQLFVAPKNGPSSRRGQRTSSVKMQLSHAFEFQTNFQLKFNECCKEGTTTRT